MRASRESADPPAVTSASSTSAYAGLRTTVSGVGAVPLGIHWAAEEGQ
ncbi:MAG: hypothetical protein K0R81_3438 [Microbacterium sp.]|nr:hypothetical protein [Microbacterium sp.]